MAFTLFPKSIRFFDLLIQQNELFKDVATELSQLFDNYSLVDEALKRISIKEERGDELCREIARQLSSSFITPIDREDIYRISLAQEDSINVLKSIATRTHISGFGRIRFPAQKMMENIQMMAVSTGKLIGALQGGEEVGPIVRESKDLKLDCEMLLSTGLAELQDGPVSEISGVVDIIKWIQVYDRIEQVIERIDDLVDAIEEVVLKNA
ncbi:MAG: DUF47 family protein [Desulforhopalus sp.]|nr:DUF47 family protein [Desulforhopalus sp.]